MKSLVLFFGLLIAGFSFAGEKYPERSDYELISKKADPSLKMGYSMVIFRISGINEVQKDYRIVWSVDTKIDTTIIGDNQDLRSLVKAGKHDFKFYYTKKYREIITHKLSFESGYIYTYQLNFKSTERNMEVKKPVIYLYPESELNVNVSVKPQGEMVFTYPVLPEDGWNVLAKPSGKLLHEDQELNYLFWESEQKQKQLSTSFGFFVSKDSTISFLEDKLSKFGLTSEEQADFITFWGPQLIKNEMNFIQFAFNEACDEYATLSITPKPDHVYRIYMLYSSAEDVIINFNTISTQEIPSIDRSGFTVIEWGGMSIDNTQLTMDN